MASVWVESVERGFEQTLGLLAAAVRDCPVELWVTSMWHVPPPDAGRELLGPSQQPVTDPPGRFALVQRNSTPWAVAWHALEVLDYDLTGEFGPWTPPPPFAGHPHWRDVTRLPAGWSQAEILGYIDHCRERVHSTLAAMTKELASRPLPPAHRYHGQPHAQVITSLLVHTTEHASQIRQFKGAEARSPS